jgi:hypothetical protein
MRRWSLACGGNPVDAETQDTVQSGSGIAPMLAHVR